MLTFALTALLFFVCAVYLFVVPPLIIFERLIQIAFLGVDPALAASTRKKVVIVVIVCKDYSFAHSHRISTLAFDFFESRKRGLLPPEVLNCNRLTRALRHIKGLDELAGRHFAAVWILELGAVTSIFSHGWFQAREAVFNSKKILGLFLLLLRDFV